MGGGAKQGQEVSAGLYSRGGSGPTLAPPVDPPLVEENVEVHQTCNGPEEAFGYKKPSSC